MSGQDQEKGLKEVTEQTPSPPWVPDRPWKRPAQLLRTAGSQGQEQMRDGREGDSICKALKWTSDHQLCLPW